MELPMLSGASHYGLGPGKNLFGLFGKRAFISSNFAQKERGFLDEVCGIPFDRVFKGYVRECLCGAEMGQLMQRLNKIFDKNFRQIQTMILSE